MVRLAGPVLHAPAAKNVYRLVYTYKGRGVGEGEG